MLQALINGGFSNALPPSGQISSNEELINIAAQHIPDKSTVSVIATMHVTNFDARTERRACRVMQATL